jgi:hypothetical protein
MWMRAHIPAARAGDAHATATIAAKERLKGPLMQLFAARPAVKQDFEKGRAARQDGANVADPLRR